MTISKKKKAQKGACRYSASTKLRLRLLARILPPLALLCHLLRVFPPCHTAEYDHIRPLLACTANGFLQRKMFLQPVSSNRRTAVPLSQMNQCSRALSAINMWVGHTKPSHVTTVMYGTIRHVPALTAKNTSVSKMNLGNATAAEQLMPVLLSTGHLT